MGARPASANISADGIAEDIITELSRFSELFVIARNFELPIQRPVRSTSGRSGARSASRYVLTGQRSPRAASASASTPTARRRPRPAPIAGRSATIVKCRGHLCQVQDQVAHSDRGGPRRPREQGREPSATALQAARGVAGLRPLQAGRRCIWFSTIRRATRRTCIDPHGAAVRRAARTTAPQSTPGLTPCPRKDPDVDLVGPFAGRMIVRWSCRPRRALAGRLAKAVRARSQSPDRSCSPWNSADFRRPA